MKTKFIELKEIIHNNNSFALFGHINPDGDAIGSILGIGELMENLGKKVNYFTPTSPSPTFKFLNIQKIKTDFDFGQYDVLVFCDFSAYSRISKFLEQDFEYFEKNKIVIIDHHENEKLDIPANFVLKDADAVSCCELIWEFVYSEFREKITEQIATNFLTGQITDSGNFFYDKDCIRVFENTLQMIKYGGNKTKIQKNIFYNKSIGDLEILKLTMGRIKKEKNILRSWFEDEDIKKLGVQQESAKVVLSQMQKTSDFDLFLLLHFKDGECKIHFRSNTINVSDLAKKFGGGGHKSASGATILNKGKTEKEEIIKIIMSAM